MKHCNYGRDMKRIEKIMHHSRADEYVIIYIYIDVPFVAT